MDDQRWLPPIDRSTDAAALFSHTTGREPEGIWAAPGRINLIGEHIDYNDGCCLPTALPHRTYAAVGRRTDRTLRLVSDGMPDEPVTLSIDSLAPGSVTGWAAYLAGVVWAMRNDGHDVPGLDVAVSSSVPLGAGLSSSAALECSLALAIAELLGLPTDDAGRRQLAGWCVQAENRMAGANTGGMDQEAALRCTCGNALLLDTRSGAVEQVRFDPSRLGLEVLVIDTNAHHTLVDGQYAARRADCERAAALLGLSSLREVDHLDSTLSDLRELSDGDDRLHRRVRHVVTEMQRVSAAVKILGAGNVAPLGRILSASHASLRDDYEVSCPELDVAVETAEATGALGARMIGGGFGGSAIALVPIASVTQVADAVTAAFAERGFDAPNFLDAPVSAGAERIQ